LFIPVLLSSALEPGLVGFPRARRHYVQGGLWKPSQSATAASSPQQYSGANVAELVIKALGR
jgi:hypothetical protein